MARSRVMKRSPAVAMKGELMPSKLFEIGIRPRWVAKNTAPNVDIHMRSAARTVCDPMLAVDHRLEKLSFAGRPSFRIRMSNHFPSARFGLRRFNGCHQHSPTGGADKGSDADADSLLDADFPTEIPKQHRASDIDEPVDDRHDGRRMCSPPSSQDFAETIDHQNCKKQKDQPVEHERGTKEQDVSDEYRE